MAFTLLGLLIAAVLFLGMLGFLELGYRRGRRETAQDFETWGKALGSAEGAIYALLGLLLAFSFSRAANRFDDRREQVVEEANAVGAAYGVIDTLPAELQPRLREKFRRYVDARLALYRVLPDMEAAQDELVEARRAHDELWAEAVEMTRVPQGPPPQVILLPLNAMFAIGKNRTAIDYFHPPLALFGLLVILAFTSAFLVGHNMSASARKSRLHMVAYSAALASVIYVVIDLELPRVGMIRITGSDRFLVEVRDSMK